MRIKKRAFYDPQDWNLYVYCGNNPVRFIDSDGKIKRDKRGEIIFRPIEEKMRTHASVDGEYKVIAGYIFTDRNHVVEAHKNKSAFRQVDYNCHGFTFGDKKFWINNPAQILKDEYKKVEKSEVKVGSVVVWRDNKSGDIEHSAVVSKVDEKGNIYVNHKPGGKEEEHDVPLDKAWSSGKEVEYYEKVNNEDSDEKKEPYKK